MPATALRPYNPQLHPRFLVLCRKTANAGNGIKTHQLYRRTLGGHPRRKTANAGNGIKTT